MLKDRKWSASRLSIVFTILALGLWSYSLTQANFHIGFLGIIESLPISFFIALVFLTLASAILWVSREKHGRLLFLQLIFFITALWLTPVLIGGSLPFRIYRWWYWGEQIFQNGQLLPGVIPYHDWPGSLIVYSSVGQVLGIDLPPDMLVRIYPFLFQFLLLLPLYLLLRNTLGEYRNNYHWAAAWLFYLANWVGQCIMSAQAIGFLLALFMFAILTKPNWQRGANALSYRLIIIILLVTIIVTHTIASAAVFLIIVALFAARRIEGVTLPILALVFIASWAIYVAVFFFNEHVPALLMGIVRLDTLFAGSVAAGVSGSASHGAIVNIRILTSLMFLGIAFAGYLLSWKTKRSITADKTVLAMAIGALFLVMILGASIGPEALQRFWLFILVPVAYFGVRLLNFKISAAILVILLLIAVPLRIISHLGNEAVLHVSPAYVASSQFIHERATSGHRIGTIYTRFGKNLGGYGFYFDELEWRDNKLVLYSGYRDQGLGWEIDNVLPEGEPFYIFIGEWDKGYSDFNLNEPYFVDDVQDALDNTVNCNLIYSNLGQALYVSEE